VRVVAAAGNARPPPALHSPHERGRRQAHRRGNLLPEPRPGRAEYRSSPSRQTAREVEQAKRQGFLEIEWDQVEERSGYLVLGDGSLWRRQPGIPAEGRKPRDHRYAITVPETGPAGIAWYQRALHPEPETLDELLEREERKRRAIEAQRVAHGKQRERLRKRAQPVTVAHFEPGLPPTLRAMVEHVDAIGGKVEVSGGRLVVSLPPLELGPRPVRREDQRLALPGRGRASDNPPRRWRRRCGQGARSPALALRQAGAMTPRERRQLDSEILSLRLALLDPMPPERRALVAAELEDLRLARVGVHTPRIRIRLDRLGLGATSPGILRRGPPRVGRGHPGAPQLRPKSSNRAP
jgi:hypothetical protein